MYVVWSIVLLSLFAAAIGSQAFFALGLVDRFSEQLRASYVARGALQYAIRLLEGDETASVDGLADRWAQDAERSQSRPLGDGRFSLTALTDEERHVSLNAAPVEMLQRFFEMAGGLREDEAMRVADAIEDWRDPDDRERPRGAEGIYYRSLSDGYDCKNGPFENLEELRLIRGITPALYQRVAPYLTVYGSGQLNLNTADGVALDALGLSRMGLDGFVAFRSGEDGVEGTWDDRVLVSLGQLEAQLAQFVPVEDIARLTQLATGGVLGVGSTAFRLTINADTGRLLSRVTAVSIIGRDGMVKLWAEQ